VTEKEMPVPLFHVDAFTDRPFAGNPAAVCVLKEPRDETWLRGVANDMNLSETAYLLREGEHFRLRWFTPTVEVDLCGHATLASAHVLWSEGFVPPDAELLFDTRSGRLKAARVDGRIELDFPLTPEQQAPAPDGLLEALGVPVEYVGRNRFDYLALVESESVVCELSPNFPLLASLGVRGVIVTAVSSTPGFDFVSRFFAPGAGIDEDPVTGSAHCCLADFWGRRLGKTAMIGFQASRRTGIVHVRLDGDRVKLGGQAVTVARGTLLV